MSGKQSQRSPEKRSKPGPEAEKLQLEGPWEEAVKKALRKPGPKRQAKKPKP